MAQSDHFGGVSLAELAERGGAEMNPVALMIQPLGAGAARVADALGKSSQGRVDCLGPPFTAIRSDRSNA